VKDRYGDVDNLNDNDDDSSDQTDEDEDAQVKCNQTCEITQTRIIFHLNFVFFIRN